VTLAALILLDVVLIALLDVVRVRPIAHWLRRRLGEQRLGRLPSVSVPTAEGLRQDQFRQLGEAGTYDQLTAPVVDVQDRAAVVDAVAREGRGRG
jgi:hypothetical protein